MGWVMQRAVGRTKGGGCNTVGPATGWVMQRGRGDEGREMQYGSTSDGLGDATRQGGQEMQYSSTSDGLGEQCGAAAGRMMGEMQYRKTNDGLGDGTWQGGWLAGDAIR
jgi:hypothetical protein